MDLTGNILPASTDVSAFTVDVTAPALAITTRSGMPITGSMTIRASEPVTGVSGSTVHVVRKGTRSALAGRLRQGATPTTWVFTPSQPLITGATYVLSVSSIVQDQSGNSAVVTGRGVRTTRFAPNTSKGWTYSSGWHRHAASGARRGSYRSATAGHSATITVVGGELNLYACKSPSMGTITVTVAGHSTKVSEHQSFTRCGVLVFHRPLPKGAQRVRIAVTKRSGNIDEVTVT
jgi:hypothetical protein